MTIESRQFSGVGYETTKVWFLVEVYNRKMKKVLEYYFTQYAYNGHKSEHKVNRAYNYVQSGLSDKTIETGLEHSIVAYGDEHYVRSVATAQGVFPKEIC